MGSFLSIFARTIPSLIGYSSTEVIVQNRSVVNDAIRPIRLSELQVATDKLRRALRDFESTLGPHPTFSIIVKDHLATLYAWQRTLVETEDLYAQRLRLSRQVGGIPPYANQKIETQNYDHRFARRWSYGHQTFDRDVKLLDAGENWIHATALLDTQCHIGNWISKRLVQRLGKSSLVSSDFEPPHIVEASGQPVSTCGVIQLSWKWHPRGTRIHECQFYVFPNSEHLDILFGVDYIVSENLIHVNESAIVPLVEHKMFTKGEKAAIAAAKEQQRQEKAALAEYKKQQAEKAQSQQGSHV